MVQAGGNSSAELRSAAEGAIACIEPYMSDAATCRLGLDGDTTAACFAANSALEFADYATVPMASRRCIAHRGYTLREAAISIANELSIPATCHSFHRNSVYNFKCAADVPTAAPCVVLAQQDCRAQVSLALPIGVCHRRTPQALASLLGVVFARKALEWHLRGAGRAACCSLLSMTTSPHSMRLRVPLRGAKAAKVAAHLHRKASCQRELLRPSRP